MNKLLNTVSLILLTTFLAAVPNLKQDKLIQKSIEIAKKNWNMVPGETYKVETVMNNDGKIKKKRRIRLKYWWNETENQIENDILEAHINRKKLDKKVAEVKFQAEVLENIVPTKKTFFLNEKKDNPKLKPLRLSKKIKGKMCYAYEFEFEKEKRNGDLITQKGKVFVDRETGAILLKEMTIDPLPNMTKKMKFKVEYFYKDEVWAPEKLTINANMSFFFFKRKIEAVVTFKNYWKMPVD